MNYWNITDNGDYLSHHGIEGQQWGVRHGPPYPLQKDNYSTTIKAGHKIQRVSHVVENDDSRSGSMYFTFDKRDQQRYEKVFGTYLKFRDTKLKDINVNTFENIVDLKAPSLETAYNEFSNLWDNDPQFRSKLGEYYKYDKKNVGTILPKSFYSDRYRNNPDSYDKSKIYNNVFVRSLGSDDAYVRNKYFDSLSKKGYNFVIDRQDQLNNMGYYPAIMFDRGNKVKFVDSRKAETFKINDKLDMKKLKNITKKPNKDNMLR